MPQVINTNIGSLNSQRHLNNTQSALSTAMERLSSGKRINAAKDDAAGLGISDRMTAQINGMNQAIRNARDGISMSQTAEGALSTSRDMLQRIRTLAVQSSNATNASLDRQAIQDEVNELTSELNRIAQTTQFNGLNLLDGTMGTQQYQVGANAGNLISSAGTNFLTNVYGTYQMFNDGIKAGGTEASANSDGTIATPMVNDVTAGHDIIISGFAGRETFQTTAGQSALSIANQVNSLTAKTGVTAKAETNVGMAFDTAGTYTIELSADNKAAGDKIASISFSIKDIAPNTDNYAEAINAINAQSAKTGVTAEYDATVSGGNGGIKLHHATGEDISINVKAGAAGRVTLNAYKADGTLGVTATALNATGTNDAGKVAMGQITYDSSSSFAVQDDSEIKSAGRTGRLVGSTLHSVAQLDLTNFKSAQLGIQICDSAINRIDKEMSRYGALQSRFESTITNLQVNSENTSNARSRIQDADYAAETAELSRTTILQQAGISMLAQANQRPQTVLSLLG